MPPSRRRHSAANRLLRDPWLPAPSSAVPASQPSNLPSIRAFKSWRPLATANHRRPPLPRPAAGSISGGDLGVTGVPALRVDVSSQRVTVHGDSPRQPSCSRRTLDCSLPLHVTLLSRALSPPSVVAASPPLFAVVACALLYGVLSSVPPRLSRMQPKAGPCCKSLKQCNRCRCHGIDVLAKEKRK